MKLILHSGGTFILRFDVGEELLAGILAFCAAQKVEAATVAVIGAASRAELRFYDLETKQYQDCIYQEELEITGLLGNVAMLDGQPAVHLHGSFGRRDMSTLSGHVQRCVISVTGEVALTHLPGRMERAPVPGTNLNLLA